MLSVASKKGLTLPPIPLATVTSNGVKLRLIQFHYSSVVVIFLFIFVQEIILLQSLFEYLLAFGSKTPTSKNAFCPLTQKLLGQMSSCTSSFFLAFFLMLWSSPNEMALIQHLCIHLIKVQLLYLLLSLWLYRVHSFSVYFFIVFAFAWNA